MLDNLMTGLALMASAESFIAIFIGLLAGIIIGAIPGLTADIAIILCLPITYSMEPIPAMLLLLGLYCGGTYGGSITAILINTPGTPSSAATVLDGYPLTQQGKPLKALTMALYASFFGGLFSALVLLFAAPKIAHFTQMFGPPEYFCIAVFGLSIIASISNGNIIKGLLGGLIGIFIALAELVADRFAQYQECEDAEAVRQEMLSVLRYELAEEAKKHSCEMHDLACTLLLAAVSEERFLLVHIGDGVIGYLDGDTLKVASVPDNGEFANETTFVTSDKAAETMRLFKGELRDKAAFVLMSDGTEHSLYHKPSRALADILTDVIQRACLIRADVLQRQLADTFASVVCPRTQDDCSIAILTRPGKALRTADQLSVEERRRLYHIQRARAHTARRIRRYDAMLVLLEQPHSLRQIAVKIHLNPRYTKQRLGQLEQLGLIEQTNGWYQKA